MRQGNIFVAAALIFGLAGSFFQNTQGYVQLTEIHPRSGPSSGGSWTRVVGNGFQVVESYFTARLTWQEDSLPDSILEVDANYVDPYTVAFSMPSLDTFLPESYSLDNSLFSRQTVLVQILQDNQILDNLFAFHFYDVGEVTGLSPKTVSQYRGALLSVRGTFDRPVETPKVLLRSIHTEDLVLSASFSDSGEQLKLETVIESYSLPEEIQDAVVEVFVALNGVDYFSTNQTINVTKGIPKLRACFIYYGDIEIKSYGWTRAGANGQIALLHAEYLHIETNTSSLVQTPDELTSVVTAFGAQGCDIIIGTEREHQYGYEELPSSSSAVYVAMGDTPRPEENVAVCVGRSFESRFLAGMAAGRMTSSNILGYVMAVRDPQSTRDLNAFTLGANKVNPAVKVVAFYTNEWYAESLEIYVGRLLMLMGADVVTHSTRGSQLQSLFHENGLYSTGYASDYGVVFGDRVLVSALLLWGPCYAELTEQVMLGTFEANQSLFHGIDRGYTDISPFSWRVPQQVQLEILQIRSQILSGSFQILCGPISDTQGNLVVPEGRCLNDTELIQMDFLVEGVEDRGFVELPRCGAGLVSSFDEEFNFVGCETCPPGMYSDEAEVHQCHPCPAGWYSVAGICQQCPAGTFSAEEASWNCTGCTEGYHQEIPGADHCNPCKPGFYIDEVRSTYCRPCEGEEYNPDFGASSCRKCPEGSSTFRSATTSEDQCVCKDHFYSNNVNNTPPCEQCPYVETTVSVEYTELGEGQIRECERLQTCARLNALARVTIHVERRISNFTQLEEHATHCGISLSDLDAKVEAVVDNEESAKFEIEDQGFRRSDEFGIYRLFEAWYTREDLGYFVMDVLVNGSRVEASPFWMETIEHFCQVGFELVLDLKEGLLCAKEDQPLSRGLVIGIVMLCIPFLFGILYGIYYYRRKYKENQYRPPSEGDERFQAVREVLEQMTVDPLKLLPSLRSGSGNNSSPDNNWSFRLQTSEQSFTQQLVDMNSLNEVTFVVTDLMDSTPLSNTLVNHYQKLQKDHDDLMRAQLELYQGYEIATQGDSFEVVFPSVPLAVKFCMALQKRLMEVPWNDVVLKHPSCSVQKTHDGRPLFRGPRVRMGIHYATEKEFTRKIHTNTQITVYDGPAMHFVRELSDTAFGGQVIMSGITWEKLKGEMAQANHPVVEHIGYFNFNSSNPKPEAPFSVFQLLPPLGSLLAGRSFTTDLRGMTLVKPGLGLSVVKPPQLNAGPGVAVLIIRLRTNTGVVLKKGAKRPPVPKSLLLELRQLVLCLGQIFQGHLIKYGKSTEDLTIIFQRSQDAIRFAMAAQVALLYADWKYPEVTPWCFPLEEKNGQVLFKGPRFAIAVHMSNRIHLGHPEHINVTSLRTMSSPVSKEARARTSHRTSSFGSDSRGVEGRQTTRLNSVSFEDERCLETSIDEEEMDLILNKMEKAEISLHDARSSKETLAGPMKRNEEVNCEPLEEDHPQSSSSPEDNELDRRFSENYVGTHDGIGMVESKSEPRTYRSQQHTKEDDLNKPPDHKCRKAPPSLDTRLATEVASSRRRSHSFSSVDGDQKPEEEPEKNTRVSIASMSRVSSAPSLPSLENEDRVEVRVNRVSLEIKALEMLAFHDAVTCKHVPSRPDEPAENHSSCSQSTNEPTPQEPVHSASRSRRSLLLNTTTSLDDEKLSEGSERPRSQSVGQVSKIHYLQSRLAEQDYHYGPNSSQQDTQDLRPKRPLLLDSILSQKTLEPGSASRTLSQPLNLDVGVQRSSHSSHNGFEWAESEWKQAKELENWEAEYTGQGLTECEQLVQVAYGGQVVVSEEVWRASHTDLPFQTQVVYLGKHWLTQGSTEPQTVMELSCQRLSQRQFPPLKSFRVEEPGFRSAPKPIQVVTIMFIEVEDHPDLQPKMKQVCHKLVAECLTSLLRETAKSFQSCTGSASSNNQRKFQGHMCKEPEPRKFVLAFQHTYPALVFACSLHQRLLTLAWPQEVLQLPGCGEQWSEEGKLLQRGLRVRVGCAHGKRATLVPSRIESNQIHDSTLAGQPDYHAGRPDYLGVVPTVAAQILQSANFGQVLVQNVGTLNGTPLKRGQVIGQGEVHVPGNGNLDLAVREFGWIDMEDGSSKRVFALAVSFACSIGCSSPIEQTGTTTSVESSTLMDNFIENPTFVHEVNFKDNVQVA